ncbi:MAG: hypothetical protein KA170_17360, partial [Candidatus Promineofilum sp.]|nr:hypothetical protein [Promineifilum sp.]
TNEQRILNSSLAIRDSLFLHYVNMLAGSIAKPPHLSMQPPHTPADRHTGHILFTLEPNPYVPL